ncbi:hypothetical protein Ddc_23592 [Ditylenchus destructor]|nr:hypothetical protein Ddc_23592 [Ditylenchus destructor]
MTTLPQGSVIEGGRSSSQNICRWFKSYPRNQHTHTKGPGAQRSGPFVRLEHKSRARTTPPAKEKAGTANRPGLLRNPLPANRKSLPPALAEERQKRLRRLVGNRQRLHAQLLLNLKRLKISRLLGQVGINKVADTRRDHVVQVAVERKLADGAAFSLPVASRSRSGGG